MRATAPSSEATDTAPTWSSVPGKVTLTSRLQRKGSGATAATPAAQHAAAAEGLRGPRQPLPYLAEIERCFGFTYDLGAVGAVVGGPATDACDQLGAHAYASGDAVAFATAPDLHTAAHEAAHVVQQRGGVQLRDGLGRDGDAYERHADEVADAVVAGRSAEALLAGFGGGGAHRAIQRKEAGPAAGGQRGPRASGDAAGGLVALRESYQALKALDAKLDAAGINRWIYDDALGFAAGVASGAAPTWATLHSAQRAPADLFAPAAPAAPSGRLPANLPPPKPVMDFGVSATPAAATAAATAKKPLLTPQMISKLSATLKVADKTLAVLGIIGGAKNIYDGIDKFSTATTRGDHMAAMLTFDQGVLGLASGATALAKLTQVATVTGLAAAALQLRGAGAQFLAESNRWNGKDSLDIGFDTYDAVSEHAGPVAGAVVGGFATVFAACGEIVWGVAATLRDLAVMLDGAMRAIMAPRDEMAEAIKELIQNQEPVEPTPPPRTPKEPTPHDRLEPGDLDGLDDRTPVRAGGRT